MFTATALLSPPTPTHAAVGSLYVSQSCNQGGVLLNLSWDAQSPAPIQYWVDVSSTDNGFAPGTFQGYGMPGFATSFQMPNFLPGSTTYYMRVNQLLQGGVSWDPSGTFVVTTQACGSAPIATTTGAGRPSLQNVTCTSSLDAASVANINPTDRKQARLNSYTGDTIRCSATAAGAYTSLTWRGPNGEEGFGPSFVTSAGPLRQPNVPNVITVTLNWNGNPALADINVYIIAPAIQTNCPPYYYPGMPSNPLLYPCGLSGPY